MHAEAFSASYAEARQRFIAAARATNAQILSYPVDHESSEPLAIDVAIIGTADAPALIVSSGIHGMEGFFGSAVQLALLESLRAASQPSSLRWVLIHALNPYGFAHLRRVNEDNVDLNRNFMATDQGYHGAPAGYAQLDPLLNPPSPPSRIEPFHLKALWHIQRTGLQALKEIIAGGQYEYPRGLFFGGKAPCATTRIVQQHCATWLASSRHIMHIDLHTGLGRYAQPMLLLNEAPHTHSYAWYTDTFGAADVQPLAQPQGTAYKVSGMMGLWMQRHFSSRDYRFAGAEFGTHDAVRVLAALRAENRAHFHCAADDPAYGRAKRELAECFAPRSPAWRNAATSAALRIVQRAAAALSNLAP